MRAPRLALALALALAGTGGCAMDLLGDYDPGGGANLPTTGAGGFRKLAPDLVTPADEPYVLTDRRAHLADPAVLRDADAIRVWCTRIEIESGASAIALAELGDLGEAPTREPAVVLEADAAWETGRVARPAVVRLDDATLALYYEGGPPDAPAIGRATSDDGGETWTKDPANPLLVDAADPGVAILGGATMLYVTRPDAPGIWLALDGGAGFVFDRAVLLPRPTLADAFDPLGLSSPSAAVLPTLDPAAPERLALHVVGTSRRSGEDLTAIGFAGSFDGLAFERPGADATLEPDTPSEGGPAALLDRPPLLFFDEDLRGRRAIGVATAGP